MKTIEQRAKEFADGLELGAFDSVQNRKIFCDLFAMFAEKYLSDNEAECNRLRTALTESEKQYEIVERVMVQKNAEPRGAKDGGCMSMNYYQQRAMTTCLPNSRNATYILLMIAEEIGELCGKVSKAIRKGFLVVKGNEFYAIATKNNNPTNDIKDQLKDELGDIMWGVAGLSHVMKWTLEDVAQYNLDKLAKHEDSGTLVTHEDH